MERISEVLRGRYRCDHAGCRGFRSSQDSCCRGNPTALVDEPRDSESCGAAVVAPPNVASVDLGAGLFDEGAPFRLFAAEELLECRRGGRCDGFYGLDGE